MFAGTISRFLLATLILGLTMVIGCGMDNTITQSQNVNQQERYSSAEEALAAIKTAVGDTAYASPTVLAAPSSGSWSKSKAIDGNVGGRILLSIPGVADSFRFKVAKNSMGLAGSGDDDDDDDDGGSWVTISMALTLSVVEDASGELLESMNFEFGPSGLNFSPDATLRIPFEALVGLDIETLVFECESGGQIEDVTYSIDWTKERLTAYVPHFSKYYFERR